MMMGKDPLCGEERERRLEAWSLSPLPWDLSKAVLNPGQGAIQFITPQAVLSETAATEKTFRHLSCNMQTGEESLKLGIGKNVGGGSGVV